MGISRIHSKGSYRHEEAIAGAAGIYPGMLVKLNSDGEVVVHATSGGFAEVAFATEDALQGRTVETVYDDEAVVTYILPEKGGEVNALLKDGQDVDIGDQLISGGDGTLIKTTGTPKQIIAIAMEAKDLSASANVTNELIRVRVL